jgi:hypothetical protein
VHAERDLDAQSLHAPHVRPHDIRHDTHQVDQARRNLRRCWLGGRADCLFHGLYAFQWLLGCSCLEPTMHDFTTLRDGPSGVQSQQRRLDHRGSNTNDRIAHFANQAESRVGRTIQHGNVRRKLDIYDSAYMLWYTREASVAVYVANLPGIWPLAREHIRFLRDHTSSYITGQSRMPRYGYGSNYGNMSKHQRSHIRTTNTNVEPDEVELKDSYNKPGARSISSPNLPGHESRSAKTSLDSDERAINDLSSWKGIHVMEVQVNTKVEIQRGSWDGTDIQGIHTSTQIEGGRKA